MSRPIKVHQYDNLKDFFKAIESAENLGFYYSMSQQKDAEDKSYWVLSVKEERY